jgi:methionine biosynthesis protein MetW
MTSTTHLQNNPLRPDLALIASWIQPGSKVLDLGCGDGSLLAALTMEKKCKGYGVEIDDSQVLACAQKGVSVIQQNIEQGLDMFIDERSEPMFDHVVLSMAIQATHETEKILREMAQIGRDCIVSFPNFGHWFHIWSIFKGRMPVSSEMPYQWYNTPNLHLATRRDFEDLLAKLGLRITDQAFLQHGRPVSFMTGHRATQAFYRFSQR